MSPRYLSLGVLLIAAAWAPARAVEPIVAAPLVQGEVRSPAPALVAFESAQRAIEMGLPSVAADLYAGLLANEATPPGERNALVLALVTARLDQGQTAEAEKILKTYVGPATAAYRLRAGLIAVRLGRLDVARSEAAAVKPEELPAGERSWLYFLQGQLAYAAGDWPRAKDFFQQAVNLAGSELQRARFVLNREMMQLSIGPVTEADLAQAKRNFETSRGSEGHGFALIYAATLAALRRTGEAVSFLQSQRQALPAEDTAANDKYRLMLGLIGGAQPGSEGRNALESLLARAGDRDFQRVALQLLARGSMTGAREEFRRKLDELIDAPTAHPILEELLLFRAQFALGDREYARADADAKELLAKFPGSQLKGAAYGVLTRSAWEVQRYRPAANWANQARGELPAGELRAALALLVAEAYTRAKDYRNAADAYAAALRESPLAEPAGSMMFKQVWAEIEAGKTDAGTDSGAEPLGAAQKLLDELSRDPRLDAINRWQAEWSLSKELQAAGRTAVAFARVNRLLSSTADTTALPAELRVRMRWLQARLASDTGAWEQTLTLTQGLLGGLDGISQPLRGEVEASTRLLQAVANFQLDRPEVALGLLKSLREDFKDADAAVYSYIEEANYYVGKNRFVDAQALLTQLADKFKQHPYAPYALYLAALNAERRGQDIYFEEAYLILERIVKDYPKSDEYFYARLKQGDLARRLNQFGRAQLTYEFLINTFPQHPDVLAAELALAACHRAQAGSDTSLRHFESAMTIFERLQELPTASVDLRVEAGFQLGDLLVQRGKAADLNRAQTVWWTVVTVFLLDEAKGRALGATGRSWMSKTLLRLGDLRLQQGDLAEAAAAYEMILRKGLPYANLARSKLQRVGGKP